MKLPEISVARPVTVTIAVTIAILLGAVSLSRLSVDLLPEINFPVAAVATSYEGAGPQEIELLVSRPIEEVMTTIGNIKNVGSTSTRGQSVVIVEFNWGADMDFATLEMREKVDQVRPLLPDGAGDPRVLKFDPSASPVMQIGMAGSRSVSELKEIAEETVTSRLERIEGVASVQINGGQERQVHVTLDPALMRTLGVTFQHVTQSLQAANLNLPGGRIETGTREVTIRTTGEFQSLEDFERVRITTVTGGVFLGDIAAVRMGFSDLEQYTRLNGNPSVGLDILKETGANSVQVARLVRQAIAELSQELGSDIEFVTVSDESTFIEGSIQGVTQNAIIGGILAMAVLIVFLRSPRTTAIIATSIPISIIATFVIVYFMGMTLNMMSLGGLALGVGMVVDNSIVVLENVYRHRQAGKEARDAAVSGTSEVGTAVVASTLTTVAVFLPVIFIEGLASQIFADLSLTVTFSLIASLVVSLTLIPTLASRVLKGVKPSTHSPGPQATEEQLEVLSASYGKLLRRVLRRRGWVFVILLVAMASSALLVPKIGQEFLPAFDEGQIAVHVELAKGSRLSETDQVVAEAERRVASLPGVAAVFSQSGVEGAPDEGRLIVQLVPREERRETTQEYMETIRTQLATIIGADISVSSISGLTGNLGGAPIQVQIRGDDLEQLNQVAADVAELVRTVPGARDVAVSTEDSRPEIQVRVDREKAGRLDLSVAQTAMAVRTAIEGQAATVYRTGGDEIDVVVRLNERSRNAMDDLYQVPVGTPYGLVPLGEVAEFIEAESPVSIDRTGQARAGIVSAQLADRPLGTVMNDIRAVVGEYDLPSGVEIAYTGENEQMTDAFGDLGFALVLAVFLVYGVMASQFESFAQPFTILLTVPFALVGVVWSLYLTGNTLNVVAFVGLIMLAGIAVNNAIVLVDYVNQLRGRGHDRTEALVQAGMTRLRPILMTTLTTVLGMVPLALGLDEGSELQAPMAIVVIGGLSLSTFLILLVIPTLYTVMDDFAGWIRRQVSRKETKGVVS